MTDLRERLFDAELKSRPHAENPDDLLDDWLIPEFEAWQAERERELRERIEALDTARDGESLPVHHYRSDVLRLLAGSVDSPPPRSEES